MVELGSDLKSPKSESLNHPELKSESPDFTRMVITYKSMNAFPITVQSSSETIFKILLWNVADTNCTRRDPEQILSVLRALQLRPRIARSFRAPTPWSFTRSRAETSPVQAAADQSSNPDG